MDLVQLRYDGVDVVHLHASRHLPCFLFRLGGAHLDASPLLLSLLTDLLFWHLLDIIPTWTVSAKPKHPQEGVMLQCLLDELGYERELLGPLPDDSLQITKDRNASVPLTL